MFRSFSVNLQVFGNKLSCAIVPLRSARKLFGTSEPRITQYLPFRFLNELLSADKLS